MAHLLPGMEFPPGPHVLLIAALLIDFVLLMLIIGASVWFQSRAEEANRAARPTPSSPRHRATPAELHPRDVRRRA
jgi:hypothetical protein